MISYELFVFWDVLIYCIKMYVDNIDGRRDYQIYLRITVY